MNRMMIIMACLSLAGGVGCSDDEGETGAGTGAGGTPATRVDAILALSGDAMAGEMAYPTLCGGSACHGADGRGTDALASDLSARVPALSDEELVGVIVDGFSGTEGTMPALGGVLSDQEIADLLVHVRATFP